MESVTVDCDQALGNRANRYFVDPLNAQRVLASGEDRWFLSTTGGASWKRIFPGVPGTPYFAGAAIYFREAMSDGQSRWVTSADDGATFTEVMLTTRAGTNAPPGTRFHGNLGFTLEGRALFTPDDGATIVMLDGNAQAGVNAFVDQGYVYVSSDDGITYERRDNVLQPRDLRVLSDGRLLLNAFADETDEFTLFVSGDRGETWSRIAPEHYPSRHIRRFTVGPGAQELWAEYQVSINEPLRVIHSTDFGVSWRYVNFNAGGEELVPDGSDIFLTSVGTAIEFGFSVKESTTLRAFPRCLTGAGSITERPTNSWAALKNGALRAVPAANVGEAFSVHRNDGVLGSVGGPLKGATIEYPEFWLNHVDVARGLNGALYVLSQPHAYAAVNGSPFGVTTLEASTGAVDEANYVELAKIGSATMTNRQFNWRGERLWVFADDSKWVEAAIDEAQLNVRGRAVVPLQGGAARASSYRVRSPDLIWVANPFVNEQDFHIPVRPLAGLSAVVPLDCTNSTCLALPNDERADAVYLSTKYVFVHARSGLYAAELSSLTQLTRVMEAPLAMVNASVVPDDPEGALFIVDSELWRFVPDFSRVAPRPE